MLGKVHDYTARERRPGHDLEITGRWGGGTFDVRGFGPAPSVGDLVDTDWRGERRRLVLLSVQEVDVRSRDLRDPPVWFGSAREPGRDET